MGMMGGYAREIGIGLREEQAKNNLGGSNKMCTSTSSNRITLLNVNGGLNRTIQSTPCTGANSAKPGAMSRSASESRWNRE